MKTGKAPHKPLLSNRTDDTSLASTRTLTPIEEMSEQFMQEKPAVVGQRQDQDNDSDDEVSFTTADTPLKQIMTMVKCMDSKWESARQRMTRSKQNKASKTKLTTK